VVKGGVEIKLIHGSGNVYRDFGHVDAELRQARAIIASKIIDILDERKLSARAAERLTGISRSDFSRIRNAKLSRFTLDRLVAIGGALGGDFPPQPDEPTPPGPDPDGFPIP